MFPVQKRWAPDLDGSWGEGKGQGMSLPATCLQKSKAQGRHREGTSPRSGVVGAALGDPPTGVQTAAGLGESVAQSLHHSSNSLFTLVRS